MSKAATIASLIRVAAKTEGEFLHTVQQVLDEADAERTAEFFDRMNISRSVGLDGAPTDPAERLVAKADSVVSYEHEREISAGMQKFLDRHERKIKWHISHPDLSGVSNVLLLFRCAAAISELRLERLDVLLRKKDALTPEEWGVARELMNRAYLSFRNYLNLVAEDWTDTMLSSVSKEQFAEATGGFYSLVDASVKRFEALRERIEERRAQLTVLPGEPYPPVRPPNYFGGDLLGRGPWKQFWTSVLNKSHHFREATN